MQTRMHPSYLLVTLSICLALTGCDDAVLPEADTVTAQPTVSNAPLPDARYVGSSACGE